MRDHGWYFVQIHSYNHTGQLPYHLSSNAEKQDISDKVTRCKGLFAELRQTDTKIDISWLPRECNEHADWLAKIAAEIQLSSSWKASLNTHGINDLFSIGLSDIKWDQNCPGFLVGKELVWVGVGSEDVLTFEEELVWVGVGFVWEHIGKFKIVGKDYC